MSQLSSKISWIIIACLGLALLLLIQTKQKIEYRDKVVTKIQERVRTVTKIKVSPDGTKETTTETVSNKDTTVDLESTKLSSKKTWTVFATATSDTFPNLTPTYGVGFTRDLILGVQGGLYATNKGELGLALSYSF